MRVNKHLQYEIEKAMLQELNLPYEEYDRKLRELAKKLKI